MMKQRKPIIHIELRENTQLQWNEAKICFELINEDGEISSSQLISHGECFEREGKTPKILRLFKNSSPGTIPAVRQAEFHNRYLAVDTSYKTYGDKLICATACIMIEETLDHHRTYMKGEQVLMRCSPRLIFAAKRESVPERYGWMKMLQGLLNSKLYDPTFKYGFVVDSELNLLQKINARDEPVFEELYSPTNINFIYASADVGKDNLVNKLISSTDKVAHLTLKNFLSSSDAKDLVNMEVQSSFIDIKSVNDQIDFTI